MVFTELKFNRIGATDTIIRQTGKNSRNNVFTKKQTTNKGSRNIFRSFKVTKKVRLMF